VAEAMCRSLAVIRNTDELCLYIPRKSRASVL
jgi:hypothetical protein